ncbi:MAG TPA: hypothetical protein VNV44_15605 [Solirubrobacteraceae bacterium]|nr:hypothetical protein [Solirubrobacteraceae bacterium]
MSEHRAGARRKRRPAAGEQQEGAGPVPAGPAAGDPQHAASRVPAAGDQQRGDGRVAAGSAAGDHQYGAGRAPAGPAAGDDQHSASRAPAGERDRLAREALEPLAPDERPPALLVAIAVCAVLAVVVIVGALSIHDLSRRGGSVPGAVTIAIVLALLAQGMWRRRYWAVLSFEALLAFQIIVTCLALVVASTLVAAAACVVAIGLGGWLFWKLVRVMGRIQAGERGAD